MYQHIKDKSKNLLVNTDTGELFEGVPVLVPAGSKIITPDQQKAQKEWNAKKSQREIRRKLQDELGYFYFVMREHEFGNISAESAARLIYLCTYLNYNNEFMLTRRTKMKKADLGDVLTLSARTTYYFWKEVENTYISDFGDEGLKLVSPFIVRGRIKGSDEPYKKFYLEGVKNVYKATPVNKHKYLGYIFQLLPYVNTEYNILCGNPDESDFDKIEPLLINEICDILQYDKNHRSRLMNIYRQLTFEYRGQTEWFVTFITPQDCTELTKAYVNPHILYSGSDYHKVEVLGAFTRTKK